VNHLVPKALLTTFLATACALLLNGCAGMPASLNPHSSAAAQIALLWWVMFVLGAVIWVGVTILLLVGLFRRRHTPEAYAPLPEQQQVRTVNLWIVGGGIMMPTLVLIALIALTVGTLRSIAAEKPIAGGGIVIEVTGHQWWWEVRYPEQGITLQDELRIPAGQPVEVRLSSADVIHSFWVPELHGKFDLVPGRTYTFVLQADRPGEYRGRCAEFCGRLHARMTFMVVAVPPEEFNAWLNVQAQPVATPQAP
jgi:cytochrome c oxidase subunit 2